ncbi:hypothetical protein PR202_ga03219 [Eleusine coracana subsp. coracana]|uniref:ABC1 atypical kinase-like domain-containing protein n=1 Tax=Eleusine coracana subsp. coracana TaxID=191504 RepID=A0AAV5BPT1_ELECO|nr:hypothetical protein PR202_ga03219 [Eleusine coracana subsp. coracana]
MAALVRPPVLCAVTGDAAGRTSGPRSRSGRGGAGTSRACRTSRGSRAGMAGEEAGVVVRWTRCWECSAATVSSSRPQPAPRFATSSGSASWRSSSSSGSSRNPNLLSNSRFFSRRKTLQPSRLRRTRQVLHRRRDRIPIQLRLSCTELMMADFQALKVYIGSSQKAIARRFLGSKQQQKSQQQSKPKLEEHQKEQQQIIQPPAFPPPSYPPGLSCMELMMADLESLKLYINYYSTILTTPLPQHYDPDLLAQYFASRPHILAFRTIQILFAFFSAAVKLQISKRLESAQDATYSSGFNASKYMVGQLLKETFLDLGPTFVKVGQSLSTRPDIIGSEICEALAELHERVPPFPREDAMKIIEGEFDCPVSRIFSYVSDEPVAAASFGQVYQGRTVDGALVAIKLGFVRKVAKRRSNISLYADELGRGFVGELDYNIEAANATKFLEFHSRYPFILVPKVLKSLTRKRVLTMEWVAGENPKDLLSLSKGVSDKITEASEKQKLEAKTRLLDLVKKGVEASLVQLLETGLLHADPHPGNLRYTPEGHVSGLGSYSLHFNLFVLALGTGIERWKRFLDFGLLCMMEKKHQRAMLASIVHIVNGDWASLVYDLTEMDVVPPRTNLRRVTMELEDALGEVAFEDGIPEIKFSKVLGKIWSVALKYHFRMPPYYTLVLRSLASLEGLAVAADETFKTFQAAYPYVVRKLLSDNSPATRRLLNQNGKSLARDMISKDALMFRVLLSKVIADVVCQWMLNVTGLNRAGEHKPHTQMTTRMNEGDLVLSKDSSTLIALQAALRDRRLQVIFAKFMRELKEEPLLMVRVSWNMFVISVTSAAVGLHRFMVLMSEKYLTTLPPPVPPPRLVQIQSL